MYNQLKLPIMFHFLPMAQAALITTCLTASLSAQVGVEKKLFNGKDFTGWEFHNEAEKAWLRMNFR